LILLGASVRSTAVTLFAYCRARSRCERLQHLRGDAAARRRRAQRPRHRRGAPERGRRSEHQSLQREIRGEKPRLSRASVSRHREVDASSGRRDGQLQFQKRRVRKLNPQSQE